MMKHAKRQTWMGRWWNRSAMAIFSGALVACSTSGGVANAPTNVSSEDQIAGMYVVDCLLPGQLRKLGTMTYQTPRRPVKTTASDCSVRGGEYVAYDRADYKTALKVWLPSAEAGDAQAQVSVGEIFEKGLGTDPNYEVAALWYGRAAEQGNKQAQFNLGTLYEQGLGVEKNKLKALNLYRAAWGLPEDSVIYQQAAEREQRELKAELEKQLASKDAQLKALESQIKSLRGKLDKAKASASTAAPQVESELAALTDLVSSIKQDRNEVASKISTIPELRKVTLRTPTTLRTPGEPAATQQLDPALRGADHVTYENMDFGRYYALIIGNRKYDTLDSLETPIADARDLGKVLEEKYGFRVQLLLDADRLTVMRAINELHEVLTEQDNLLVYYAGHGSLVNVGERSAGYWLPTNADQPPDDSHWVPNEFVTNHLGRMKAKRVLVIADSCYGGLLSASPGHLFFSSKSDAAESMEYLRYKMPRRSRLLLSSGGDKPVIDEGGGEHSVFARELLNILESNTGILTAPDLYASIKKPVMVRARAVNFVQEPVYKSIKGAGHEVGDFFFVPKSASK
jgi:uncharacterized protein